MLREFRVSVPLSQVRNALLEKTRTVVRPRLFYLQHEYVVESRTQFIRGIQLLRLVFLRESLDN